MKAITPRHGIDSAFLRVSRAQEHLVDLQGQLATLADRYRYAFITHYDPNPPYDFLVRSRIGKPAIVRMPPRMAILIGEICYNLRCALDYLAYALAFLGTNRQPTGTQFPVESNRQGFEARRNTYLKGISDTHVAMIERLQPYNGIGWLASLRDFNDFDKHNRFVNVKWRVVITRDDISRPTTYVIRTPLGHPRGEVNVNVSIAIEILFRKGTLIGETLEEIQAGVAQTLTDFKPEFER